MVNEQQLDDIYHAKLKGLSDMVIMKQFSVSLREIEKAVLRKTGTNLNLFQSKKRGTSVSPINFEVERKTVWSFKSRGKWATHNGDYRGNWSPYIPRNVILRYSAPGDIVLDQFSGGGTTAVEARLLGRKCIARDINPSAIKITKSNLDFTIVDQNQAIEDDIDSQKFYEPIVEIGDALNLSGIEDNSIDLICTHPPYANIVNYSDGIQGDISFHDVDLFIGDMRIVAKECYRVLKPGGICAILIGDTRKKKHVVPMGFRTIDVFLNRGFNLQELIIKRQHNCRTSGFWYTSSIKHNFLLLAQEYLPIFAKPNSRKQHTKSPITVSPFSEIRGGQIPKRPEKMECKTTWVFPDKSFDESVDANILNRYGIDGGILQIENAGKSWNPFPRSEKMYSLVYCKLWYNPKSTRSGIQDYANLVKEIVDDVSTMLMPDGHLAIRLKDVREGNHTVSPALKIWKIPLSSLKVREIIVAVSESPDQTDVYAEELEINHEFVLVYRKPMNK